MHRAQRGHRVAWRLLLVGVGPPSGKRNAMHIDVVQLHIAIALGVVALAARVADREPRPRGSSLARVSPVRLLVPLRRRNEMQSTTPSRSISTMWLLALVMAAGLAVGCAHSPAVPSGAPGTDSTVRSQRLGEDPTLSDDSA